MMRTSADTDRELRVMLEPALAERGYGSPIQRMLRHRSPYSSSFALDRLDIALEDGREIRLVFKNVGGEGLLNEALRVKPRFLYHPEREIEMYRAVLHSERHGTPACYVALADAGTDRYWLVLERVEGHRLAETGEFWVWEAAAQWLRRFHDEFSGNRPDVAAVLTYDRSYYTDWLDRARAISARTSELHYATVTRLARCYDVVLDRLEALPVSLTHGEFYPLNVLVAPQPRGVRICPVDWEVAALAPGLMDLAAMTAGWSSAERRRLTAVYYGNGAAGFSSLDDMQRALDYCRLHHAVQWLGWSPQWEPPVEQVHDWINTASELTLHLSL